MRVVLTAGFMLLQGWAALDDLRRKLEDLRELRDLVRSLGRGGGWGPLRWVKHPWGDGAAETLP